MKRKRLPRGMSDQKRAFFALQGITFPRIGDLGRCYQSEPPGIATVEVTSVSVSGRAVTVRFVDRADAERFGVETLRVYRVQWSNDQYRPKGRLRECQLFFRQRLRQRPQ